MENNHRQTLVRRRQKKVVITIRRQIVFERCVDNRFIVDMRTTITIIVIHHFRSIFVRITFHQMAQGTLSLGGERITGNSISFFSSRINDQ